MPRGLLAAGIGLLLVLWGVAASRPVAARTRSATTTLDALEQELALARQGGFYLVLEADASRLRLMSGGVQLREYALSDLRLGTPRLFFVGRAAPAPSLLHDTVRLEPAPTRETEEVLAPVTGEPAPPPSVPPRPEEAVPVPRRVRLVSDSLVLELREASEPGLADRVVSRLHDVGAALGGAPITRLRAGMERADLETLYRSLPPGSRLLVVPGP